MFKLVLEKAEEPEIKLPAFFGKNDAKAETLVLWPPHAKSWLIEKDSDAGRDWGQEEKGMTEDEMARGHHWLDGHEFDWTLGVGDVQGGLACCNSWGCKESDMTERLNWTDSSRYSVGSSGDHIFLMILPRKSQWLALDDKSDPGEDGNKFPLECGKSLIPLVYDASWRDMAAPRRKQ